MFGVPDLWGERVGIQPQFWTQHKFQEAGRQKEAVVVVLHFAQPGRGSPEQMGKTRFAGLWLMFIKPVLVGFRAMWILAFRQ